MPEELLPPVPRRLKDDRPLVARIAVGIFTAIMMYLIIAGSSGILLWILSFFDGIITWKDGWYSAKPGWGWIIKLHVLIQQPRHIYVWIWKQHPIITSIITYLFGTVLVFTMNYSDKDSDDVDEKVLREIEKNKTSQL